MCDWGVPDWQSEANYGGYSIWNIEQWRWEFKRRHRDIRTTYQLVALEEFRQQNPSEVIPQNLIWQPNYKEHVYTLSAGLATSTGYPALPNPLYSNLPYDFHYYKKQNLELRTLRGWDFEANKMGDVNWAELLGVKGIAIVFHPDKPLSPQFDGLRDYLFGLRHHSIPKDMERVQKDKWIRYLRLLDARAGGASWSECASIILPNTIQNNPQTARDSHKSAIQLQAHL